MNIIMSLSSLWLPDDLFVCAPKGFPGDFGERGPPGPDGNPVSGIRFTDLSLLMRSYTPYRTKLLHLIENSSNYCS